MISYWYPLHMYGNVFFSVNLLWKFGASCFHFFLYKHNVLLYHVLKFFFSLIVGGADVWPRGQTSFSNTAQPYHDLANLWRVWLPPEAESTFKKGNLLKKIKLLVRQITRCMVWSLSVILDAIRMLNSFLFN